MIHEFLRHFHLNTIESEFLHLEQHKFLVRPILKNRSLWHQWYGRACATARKPDDPLNLTHSGMAKNQIWYGLTKRNMDVNPFYCYFASVISKGGELPQIVKSQIGGFMTVEW